MTKIAGLYFKRERAMRVDQANRNCCQARPNPANYHPKVLLAGAILMLMLSGCSVAKVVPIPEATRIAQGGAFDAASFVEARWPEIVSTILERGVEVTTVLAAIEPDSNGLATKESLQQVATQYGLTTEGQAHVFMIKGRGVVAAANIESSRGTIEVALEGYDGPIKVTILIGPRLPSDESSVRDAVGFIRFGDFREQTEFGQVARQLNQRVSQDVLAELDRENLAGKSVSFHGAFTIRTFNAPGDINVSEIVVTPVQLEVGG
jgi:predicted lipoprotein